MGGAIILEFFAYAAQAAIHNTAFIDYEDMTSRNNFVIFNFCRTHDGRRKEFYGYIHTADTGI